MNKIELMSLMQTKGMSLAVLTALSEERPGLIESLAESWDNHGKAKYLLDRQMIARTLDERPSAALIQGLKQVMQIKEWHREKQSPRASAEILAAMSEERAAGIEREQAPVTDALAGILRQAHAKIQKDDLSFQELIRSYGVDANQKDRDGLSLLAVAAQAGADRSVFALFKLGANPHLRDSLGNTPLHWACAMEKSKTAGLFLYHGANVNAMNNMGATPFMMAIARGDETTAKKLLDYRADATMKDRRGNTALHRALLAKNKPMVMFLLDLGMSIDEPNQEGKTAAGLAMRMPEFQAMFQRENAKNVNEKWGWK